MFKFERLGITSFCNTQEDLDFLNKRADFTEEYCKKIGWPSELDDLSMEQVMEIREQDGWKNPK